MIRWKILDLSLWKLCVFSLRGVPGQRKTDSWLVGVDLRFWRKVQHFYPILLRWPTCWTNSNFMASDDWDLRCSVSKRYLWRTSWTKLRVGGSKSASTWKSWKFFMSCMWKEKQVMNFTIFCLLQLSQIFMHTAAYWIPKVYRYLMSETAHGPALEYLLLLCNSRCWAAAWEHPEGKASGLTPSKGKMFQLQTSTSTFWCTFLLILWLPFSQGFCCKMQGERLNFVCWDLSMAAMRDS